MTATKKIPGTEPKAATPKPFLLTLESVNYTGFNFASDDVVRLPIRADFKRTSKVYANACMLRPRQYAVKVRASRPAYTDYRNGKEVKIEATEPHDIFESKDAKISSLRVLPGFSQVTMTFMLTLPVEFAEKSAKIGEGESVTLEITAPQLALV